MQIYFLHPVLIIFTRVDINSDHDSSSVGSLLESCVPLKTKDN